MPKNIIMELSWTGLKISIAGARLSHLVQRDKIWDYGSMVEQVKAVFHQMEKAKRKQQPEIIEKYVTARCYEFFNKLILSPNNNTTEKALDKIAIIEAHPGKKDKPDMFCALIRGSSKDTPLEKFTTRWLFIRQGSWWILDQIKSKNLLFII